MFSKKATTSSNHADSQSDTEYNPTGIHPAILFGGAFLFLSTAGTVAYAAMSYKICPATQFLIRTGLGIKDFQVKRSCVRWPLQKITRVDMTPFTVTVAIDGPTSDLIPTSVPISFTMRPIDPNFSKEPKKGPDGKIDPNFIEESKKGFDLYIRRMSSVLDGESREREVMRLLEPCVKGEGRTLIANMPMDKLFSDKHLFRSEVEKILVEEISKYGLEIQNVCIQNLEDTPGNEYFSKLKQRALKNAEAKSDQDVAIAEKDKQIGVTTSKKEEVISVQLNETAREISVAASKRELETGIAEQKKTCTIAINLAQAEIEMSNAALAKITADAGKLAALARTDAEMEVKKRQADLDKELFEKRSLQELERIRSEKLTEARVAAECTITEKEAEARGIEMLATANLLKAEKEAEGVRALFNAQGEGIESLIRASCGDTKLISHFWSLEKGVYQELAKYQAMAVKDMKPNFNVLTRDTNAVQPILDAGFAIGGPILEAFRNMNSKPAYAVEEFVDKLKGRIPTSVDLAQFMKNKA